MSQFTDSNLQVPSNTGPGNHILSNSSRVAGFDIFIFWPSDPGVVMAGINSTLNPDINVGQIKTWIKLLETDLEPIEFELYPATVRIRNAVGYIAKPRARSSALESSYILQPGPAGRNYCCYDVTNVTDPDAAMPPGNFPPFTTARKTLSFDELRRDALNNPDRKPWRTPARRLQVTDMYNPPEEIQSAVKVRDGDRCFLTGSDGPPSVHWIVPPIWTRKFTQRVENGSSKGYMRALKASYSTAENAAMMCEEVADLFHRNAVGIDVDNDFRFIVFDSQLRKRMDDNPGFLKLQNKDNLTGGTVNFLRQHLKWCLSVNFMAEQTAIELPAHEVHDIGYRMAIRDLVALKAYGKGQRGIRWKTDAGKEIWDLLLSREWPGDAEDSEDIWDGFSDSGSEDDSGSGSENSSENSSDDGSAAGPSSEVGSESDSSESDY